MSILFVFSVFLLLDVPKSCIAATHYDFFMFVQQWPKGYCGKVAGIRPCRGSIPSKFTIHGLWPQTHSGLQPLDCNSSNILHVAEIKSLKSQLTLNWPNLNGVDLHFWQFEWAKHGTCSEQKFSKLQYFNQALSIYKNNKLADILTNAQIVPDDKQLYNTTSVIDAIHEHTQHDPQLQCYVDSAKNVSVIYEISVCLTADATSYTSCPNPQGSCHAQQVLYP